MSDIVWGEWKKGIPTLDYFGQPIDIKDADNGVWYRKLLVPLGAQRPMTTLQREGQSSQRLDTDSVAADPGIERMLADAAKGFAAVVNPTSAEWVPDERTVRACIDALPNMGTGKHPHSLAALEALLPKPKSLAEQWMDKSDWPDMGVQIAVEEFECWLIAEGFM